MTAPLIELGQKIRIKPNLPDEMRLLGFTEDAVARTSGLIGTEQTAIDVSGDPRDEQVFVTVDLGVEIPIQCCELV